MAGVNEVYPPEVWANESLMVLRDNLVMARLVHRDFENVVAARGDKVHTRKPSKGTAKSWSGQDATDGLADANIQVENPQATDLSITLDSLYYTAFIVQDKDESTSIKSLREEFILPFTDPLSQQIDDDLMTEFTGGTDVDGNSVSEVADDTAGAANAMDEDDIVAARQALNTAQCPITGRSLVLGTEHEGDLLKSDLFVQVQQSGSQEALVNANLGRKFGFDIYASQNVPDDTAGARSLAFHRNAIALVTRPLALPSSDYGVKSAVASLDGVGLRMTSAYSVLHVGVINRFDVLYGVQLLDKNLGAVIQP